MATTTASEKLSQELSQGPAESVSTRLVSLDVFRGLTIAGMILVNNAGDWEHVYWPLEHAPWHGWTPTDLVFPFFLFIVGVSMSLSFAARQAKGATQSSLLAHSVKRSLLIFAIGLALNAVPVFFVPGHHLRIYGVLQRIAIVYLVSSMVVLYLGRAGRLITILACLFGYWAALMLIPVPGFGAGNLTMNGNLVGFIDRKLLYEHLWIEHRFDPEGLLSNIPAVATCLVGVFVGDLLRASYSAMIKLRWLIIAGVLGLVLGKIWDLSFPINKNLWTSSYVIFTAGFAMVMLGICYWLVDIKRWRGWSRPFQFMGMNPLALYALSMLVAEFSYIVRVRFQGRMIPLKVYIFDQFYRPIASPDAASALYGLTYVLTFLILGWILYRQKIFIRV
ncbi:MAG TPA: DUF5009 domain-containing protein [Terriglobales bacterium]|nr:DUF5009 domain-containing protein [Terriglobales bacterium]